MKEWKPGLKLHLITILNKGQSVLQWLRLTPNNKISGWKPLSSRIPKGSGRLKIAYKKSWAAVITATTRKIAVILWNMVTKKQAYCPKTPYQFLKKKENNWQWLEGK